MTVNRQTQALQEALSKIDFAQKMLSSPWGDAFEFVNMRAAADALASLNHLAGAKPELRFTSHNYRLPSTLAGVNVPHGIDRYRMQAMHILGLYLIRTGHHREAAHHLDQSLTITSSLVAAR